MTTEKHTADMVVIGGGIAGLTAAVRAAQGGLRALILERSADDRYMCNSRITSGVFHCALNSIRLPPEELATKITNATAGYADERQVQAVASNALSAVRWLQELGIRFVKGPLPYHEFTLAPPTIDPQNGGWRGRGGDVLLRTLEEALARHGGKILRGHRARSLCMDNGRCVGVQGDAGVEQFQIEAGSTVIADGGFQTEPDLLRVGITSEPEKVLQRNARTGFGDGLKMARAAGAAESALNGFYGHVLSRDAFTNDRLWPHLWLDFVAAAGLLVDRSGSRFTDEGLGGVSMANAIAAQTDPLQTFTVADQAIWEDRGKFNVQAPNPRLQDLDGTVYTAQTLAELAERAGIDAFGLETTVSSYNDALANGRLDRLVPIRTTSGASDRSTGKYEAFPIKVPPFYAIPVCAGITYTLGGILIDGDSRVLDTDGKPMAGLFAVGATTGGLEGGPNVGYVGGLVKSAVTGMRAAAAAIVDRSHPHANGLEKAT